MEQGTVILVKVDILYKAYMKIVSTSPGNETVLNILWLVLFESLLCETDHSSRILARAFSLCNHEASDLSKLWRWGNRILDKYFNKCFVVEWSRSNQYLQTANHWLVWLTFSEVLIPVLSINQSFNQSSCNRPSSCQPGDYAATEVNVYKNIENKKVRL